MQVPECTFTGCGGFFGKNKVNSLERNIYLLMLGLDNSGKTCTAKSLVGDSLDDVTPTIGFAKVTTKYKGFKVTLFDLGGSKSFRGIWPKYFHEVHGFIFVVDASDIQRMDETATVFAEIVASEKVHGKPILMLCNKADVDDARDEVHIVNALQVEKLVNEAQCPTRVEPCVANKNQGLREGYKWLVRSVIAKLDVLGPRVDKDVEEERVREAERKVEVRKRIEERKKNEGVQEPDEDSQEDEGKVPGFVPISELSAAWEKSEARQAAATPITPEPNQNDGEDDIIENGVEHAAAEVSTEQLGEDDNGEHQNVENLPGAIEDEDQQPRVGSAASKFSNRRGSNESTSSLTARSGKLELEPISKPKKTNVLKKMNSRGSGMGSETSKPSSSKSNSSAGSRRKKS